MSLPTSASSWAAARTHPQSYPGRHPDGSFVLMDDDVQDVGGSLDDELAGRGLPLLADRFPLLAYGANRNPATLALKLEHYSYVSPGRGVVLPALPARIQGFDAVAGGLSSQGYLYADLFAGEQTAGTVLEVHVLLLDVDQLRVMHDSEGVRNSFYDVSVVPGVALDRRAAAAVAGSDGPLPDGLRIDAMAYLATSPVVISSATRSPMAFGSVRATGRRLPEFNALGMLAHVLESEGLLPQVRAVVSPELVGPRHPAAVAADLMRYLNGQWWYRKNTGDRRLEACEHLETMIRERLSQSFRAASSAGSAALPPDRQPGRGHLLTSDEAYHAVPSRTLAAATRHGPA